MSIDIKNTLDTLNFYLKQKQASRQFVICGSAALILQGVSRSGRETKDVDIVGSEIDSLLKESALLVAEKLGINSQWLNTDPKSLANDLKAGWGSRSVSVYTGSNLQVRALGREDMVFAKFYAYCDRQKDLDDLIDLKITDMEITEAAKQTKKMDINPAWPAHVEEQKNILRKKLGYV